MQQLQKGKSLQRCIQKHQKSADPFHKEAISYLKYNKITMTAERTKVDESDRQIEVINISQIVIVEEPA